MATNFKAYVNIDNIKQNSATGNVFIIKLEDDSEITISNFDALHVDYSIISLNNSASVALNRTLSSSKISVTGLKPNRTYALKLSIYDKDKTKLLCCTSNEFTTKASVTEAVASSLSNQNIKTKFKQINRIYLKVKNVFKQVTIYR